jgi:hypothetical protein
MRRLGVALLGLGETELIKKLLFCDQFRIALHGFRTDVAHPREGTFRV